MRIISVDPGETIGLAYYDSETKEFEVFQAFRPSIAQLTISALERSYDSFDNPLWRIVESYNSAGHLSKEGKTTIKILGYFEYSGYELVAPQARLCAVAEAKELIGEQAGTMHRNGRDAIAALAHAIAYARKHDTR